MTPFADRELAARLERLCAAEMTRFVHAATEVDPGGSASALRVAGGVAAYLGPESPLNQAFGLGFDGAVPAEAIEALEEFYRGKGARPLIGVCPLAHPSLSEALAARGWVVDGFENVLYRELGHVPATEVASSVEIREVVGEEERDLWGLVAASGFSAPLPPLPEQLAISALVVRRPGARLFLAYVDGAPAGTGELYVEDGIAWLSADTTLPQYRRRGVQQAMQAHRLAAGAAAGCQLAVSEAAPGGPSQRNMERAGFSVAYTRIDMVAPEQQSRGG